MCQCFTLHKKHTKYGLNATMARSVRYKLVTVFMHCHGILLTSECVGRLFLSYHCFCLQVEQKSSQKAQSLDTKSPVIMKSGTECHSTVPNVSELCCSTSETHSRKGSHNARLYLTSNPVQIIVQESVSHNLNKVRQHQFNSVIWF